MKRNQVNSQVVLANAWTNLAQFDFWPWLLRIGFTQDRYKNHKKVANYEKVTNLNRANKILADLQNSVFF